MFRLRALLALLPLCTVVALAAGWAARAETEPALPPKVTVARFGDELPKGWQLEVRTGSPDFSVEGGVLELRSRESSFGLRKEVRIDLERYPYLNWRWKALDLPEGGDGRRLATDDQAAQVYVVFPRWPVALRSQLLGYTWENLAPKGSSFTSPFRDATRYLVLRDRSDPLGKWVHEKRNVYEDYKKLFGSEPPETCAVLLYINSQHTESSAVSCIADLYFSRN